MLRRLTVAMLLLSGCSPELLQSLLGSGKGQPTLDRLAELAQGAITGPSASPSSGSGPSQTVIQPTDLSRQTSTVVCPEGTLVQSVTTSVSEDLETMVYSPEPNYERASTGVRPLVIVPFQFVQELPWNTAVTRYVIEDVFFGSERSINAYFSQNSWNRFSLRLGAISEPVTLANNRAYYEDSRRDWTLNPALATDILRQANIHWASFDTDQNGQISSSEVQVVFLVSEGVVTGATRPSTITLQGQQTWTISNRFVYLETARPGQDVPHPLLYSDDRDGDNFAIMVHEFGHGLFNLPDRYPLADMPGRAGPYDIMFNSRYLVNMNIYDKIKLGWIRPPIHRIETDAARCWRMDPIATTPSALVVTHRDAPNEF